MLATVVVLWPAAADAGAVSREFFGTVALSPLTAAEYNRMGQGRVGTFRIILAWRSVEPTPGERNWAPFDEQIGSAAVNGIRVLPTLYGTPAWAAPKEPNPPLSKKSSQAWGRFVADAVDRYKAGGAFWQSSYWQALKATNPGAVDLPITDWQFWNESNSPTYWNRRPSGKAYGRLLKITGRAVHGHDPSGRVILAGLFTRPNQRRAVPIIKYLNDLYEVPKIKKAFDGLAVHPYASASSGGSAALKLVKDVRKLTRRHGDGKSPIWVTEVGWASGGTPSSFTTTPAAQASLLEATFNTLVSASGRFRIAGVIWYSFKDGAGDYWLYRTGLFDNAGIAKPAWSSFVRFTGGTP